jgi:serine/threonine protein kinase
MLSYYALIFPCCKYGSLLDFLKREGQTLIDSERVELMFQALKMLWHLHKEQGIAHSDIKLENTMIENGKKNLSAIDFARSLFFG